MEESFVLKNVRLILPDDIQSGMDVRVEGGKIQQVGHLSESGVDCHGLYLCPGLIDIHTHGGYGSDFMDASEEAIENVARFHADHGTTSVLATSVTSPVPSLLRFMDAIREYRKKDHEGAEIEGVHLEGPFLSLRNKGAQKAEYLLDPQKDSHQFILDNKDLVRTVTIAPERDVDGSLTKDLTENGILVAGGHDDGVYPEFMPAIRNGLRHLTHLYCAMSDLRFKDGRRNVGLREYGLLDDHLSAEIIADGRHMPREMVQLVYKCKGRENLVVVSDSLRCAGMPPDGKLYRLGEENDPTAQRFKVADGVAVMEDGTHYAGSITPIFSMVRNLISYGIPAVDAFRAATINPARVVGIKDKGVIQEGCQADMLLLDEEFNLKQIYIKGKLYKNF